MYFSSSFVTLATFAALLASPVSAGRFAQPHTSQSLAQMIIFRSRCRARQNSSSAVLTAVASVSQSTSITSVQTGFTTVFSSSPAPTVSSVSSSSSSSTAAIAQDTSTSSTDSNGSDASDSDVDTYLSTQNSVRAQYGASALTWNNTLAAAAQQWSNGCVFQHSGGSLGPFGGEYISYLIYKSRIKMLLENLAAGTGSGYTITSAITSWTNEACE